MPWVDSGNGHSAWFVLLALILLYDIDGSYKSRVRLYDADELGVFNIPCHALRMSQ